MWKIMRNRTIIKGIIVIILILFEFILGFVTFRKIFRETDFTYLNYFSGGINIIRNNETVKPDYKMVIKSGDRIITDKNGDAFFQCGNKSIIELKKDSEMLTLDIPCGTKAGSGSINVDLLRGKAFFYVNRADKTGSFIIKTFRHKVIVTGTTLSVELEDENSLVVKVFEGLLNVKAADGRDFKVKPRSMMSIKYNNYTFKSMGNKDLTDFKNINELKSIGDTRRYSADFIKRYFKTTLKVEKM